MSKSSQSFCKEKGIPARAVWEGPGKHQHIALGIAFSDELEQAWRQRLTKLWLRTFKSEMPAAAFWWKPEIKPEQIASYLSKTRTGGCIAKAAWPWMVFNPVWEVGFSRMVRAQNAAHSIARKTRSS